MFKLQIPARFHSLFRFSLLFFAALFFTGCPGEVPKAKRTRIIILTNTESPFWDACRTGMQDAGKDFKLEDAGFTVELVINDSSNVQGQIDALRQYGSQSDIAAVGVSVTEPTSSGLADVMKELRAKGIKVITVDSDGLPQHFKEARFAYVGTQNIDGGIALGICARMVNPEGGGYVTFVGLTDQQNAVERVDGFAQGAGSKFTKLDNMGDKVDLTKARRNVRDALQNFDGKINTLVGIWSYNAPAIVEVVKKKDVRGKFTIVTFDAEPIAVRHMEDGMIDAMVVQNPYMMGYQGVKLMKALLEDDRKTIDEMLPNYGKPGGDIYDTGLKVVVPDEKSPVKKDAFSKNTKHMTLDEFKAWLKKYDLEGS